MRSLRLYAAALAALLLIAAPAVAQDTLADVIRYAKDTGRVIVETDGDSTGDRDGGGHATGAAAALMRFSQCAGYLIPPNHTSAYNETQGFVQARRWLNGSTYNAVMSPADLSVPGWPTTQKQYGIGLPFIGVTHVSTTMNDAGGINSSDNSVTLTSASSFTTSGYVLIDGELIAYSGKSTNTLTGLTRAQYATQAIAHSDAVAVYQASVWQCPLPCYLGSTALSTTILNTDVMAGAGTIDVGDATIFPKGTNAVCISNDAGSQIEIFQYTGRTGNQLTGVTRNIFSLGATTHTAGTVTVRGCLITLNATNALIRADSPLGTGCELRTSHFWMSLSATSVPQSGTTLQLSTQVTPVNTDTTWTTLTTGSTFNYGGTAVGTVNHANITTASSDRGAIHYYAGTRRDSIVGPYGPAAIMATGVFAFNRPKGVVQSMGINQGAHTLSSLHFELNKYHVASTTCEFYQALVSRYKMYIQCGAADVGGNGAVALCHVAAFGFNETGGGGYGGPADPANPWTISVTDTLADTNINDTDTLITPGTVANFAGSNALIRIGDELIFYAAQVGGKFSGCIRGVMGTIPAAHTQGDPIYQGYVEYHPKGFAATMLFDYNLRKAAWIEAGGTAATFFYVYPRSLPISASPSYIALTSIPNSSYAQKEGRLREFMGEIKQQLAWRQGFIALDPLDVFTGGELVTNENGASTSDSIHHAKSFYESAWTRWGAFNIYGPGAQSDAIGGFWGRLRGRQR